jgi:hypothetical protein
MLNQEGKTNNVTYWGGVKPAVFLPSVKREEAKINREEDSHQCQRAMCHISPFFKDTAQSISSILSDHTFLLLEGQPSIASINQVGQLIINRLSDHPLKFSAPRDKLDRYHRVFTLVSISQEVRDVGII